MEIIVNNSGLSAQVDKDIEVLNREVRLKLTGLSHEIDEENDEPEGIKESNRKVQLEILDKIWVIKNLIKELELSYEGNFAFQYSSINYNLAKLQQKTHDLKKYLNEQSTVSKKPAHETLSTPNNGYTLPGTFDDFSPEKLEEGVPDVEEILNHDGSEHDYAKNVIIIRLFELRLHEYKELFYQKLLELVDTYLVVDDSTEVKIVKEIVDDGNETFQEVLSVSEFFEFIEENHSTLVENNPNISFRKAFNEKILYFLKSINDIIGKIRIDMTISSSVEFSDSPQSYTLKYSSQQRFNTSLFRANLHNIFQFIEFFIRLPNILKYSLKNNSSSTIFKSLSGFFSFNLLVLTSGYHTCSIKLKPTNTIKKDIVLLIKFVYLLLALRIFNRNEFYFLNLDSHLFDIQLTINSPIEDYSTFLQNIFKDLQNENLESSIQNLWSANYNQLNDFLIDKKLNQIINQIKNYLQKFDTYDLIFHQLINRFEIDFSDVALDAPREKQNESHEMHESAPEEKQKSSPSKKHTSSFSHSSLAPISENQSNITTKKDLHTNKKTADLVNRNRRSNIFALNGGQKLDFGGIDETLEEDPKSYNKNALDALIGKASPTINIEQPQLKEPLSANITSPISPVTPLSPFDASNSARFSNIENKKPDDDRIRFSKRFSKNVPTNASVTSDDASSIHSGVSENSMTLNRRASKRISKKLSKRFSQNDWSWNDDDTNLDADDGWGNDDLDLDISDDENKVQDTRQVERKKSSKSINIDDAEDWGWGEEIDDADLDIGDVTVNEPTQDSNIKANTKSLDKKHSFKTTLIPDEIYEIIINFVNYLNDLNQGSRDVPFVTNDEMLNKVIQLMDIYYLVGGYSKYDSKFLFYNDLYYLNMILKKQMISMRLLASEHATSKGPILFDTQAENYLTNVINLEKISFLRIYRKFQNFVQLSNTQNTSMILTQLEFKFKEMFFASFQSLALDLQQIVVINFLNEFYQLVINDILQISLISEQDSNELSKIISHMLSFVRLFAKDHNEEVLPLENDEKDLTKDTDETIFFYKKNITNFFKLANFKIIVSSHLASIMENFYNGEFYNVETGELIHLIKALFVESDHRRHAIQEIEEIRNIDI